MEIVNIEAGTFKEMVTSIRLLKEKLESLKGRQALKGLDNWMDSQEVCMALNISQRTLQALRSNGTLPFSQIDRKTYYRKQDVIRLIEKGKNK
ncbi:helix-turn-helix domain-containing protein [Bacteroides gallinaceum]|uniref:helix-turn-helix domain-containing protein n=1 Tax=Bacteroides gallinaceum TaxID=1462571 RepID=UPI0025A47E46|nr:helix-turn-helix domain-containing protein [Bacteroides gallinaceum]MDM8155094.1 helix-turn-helix domain-containing protein [Bacteroides gallinaceum]